jgi:lipoyl(octanoyl) transferase
VSAAHPLRLRRLGLQPYRPMYAAMQAFTDQRDVDTLDEIWLLQHQPVFTQGLNGKPEHLLMPGDIPVESVDRGGQVTYHGPGQLVVYCLLDLRRRDMGVRRLVSTLEESIIELLADGGVESFADPHAPGVYVASAPAARVYAPERRKLASVGLRVRRGCSYHGLSLNVAMDLAPFRRINPCGQAGLQMTQLSDLGVDHELETVADRLLTILLRRLGYRVLDSAVTLPEVLEQETAHV